MGFGFPAINDECCGLCLSVTHRAESGRLQEILKCGCGEDLHAGPVGTFVGSRKHCKPCHSNPSFKTMKQFDYDVAVVGGGSGGYAAARTAANRDLSTVVIEGGREVGGLCILRGCMPTKALLYAAEVKHLAQHPDEWGIHSQKVTFDFARVMARKNALIQDFANYRQQQLTEATFKFIRARARFTDPHTLALSTGETLT